MIELKSLERSYKTGHTETWVLRRINLMIRQGEFVTVMGPSGAGKSSLLNVLAMLDDQWKGEKDKSRSQSDRCGHQGQRGCSQSVQEHRHGHA